MSESGFDRWWAKFTHGRADYAALAFAFFGLFMALAGAVISFVADSFSSNTMASSVGWLIGSVGVIIVIMGIVLSKILRAPDRTTKGQ